MWSGTVASIPSGWQLCDGTNGAPDLRNRFVMSVGASENPGGIGGNSSHEFMVLADTGEDIVVSCSNCHYAANREQAAVKIKENFSSNNQPAVLEKIDTPGVKNVAEVAKYLNNL